MHGQYCSRGRFEPCRDGLTHNITRTTLGHDDYHQQLYIEVRA